MCGPPLSCPNTFPLWINQFGNNEKRFGHTRRSIALMATCPFYATCILHTSCRCVPHGVPHLHAVGLLLRFWKQNSAVHRCKSGKLTNAVCFTSIFVHGHYVEQNPPEHLQEITGPYSATGERTASPLPTEAMIFLRLAIGSVFESAATDQQVPSTYLLC